MYNEDPQEETKSIPLEVRIFWFIVLTIIFVSVLIGIWKDDKDKYTYVQTVILALTLTVVSVYTYLTWKMQQAMVKQTNVSILPIVQLEIQAKGWKTVEDGKKYIAIDRSVVKIQNIGRAAALNIEIDPLFVKDSMSSGLFPFQGDPLWFGRVSSLLPNEIKEISYFQVSDIRNYEEMLGLEKPEILKYFVPGVAIQDYRLVIRFSDVLGKRYAQTFNVGKSGIFQLKPLELNENVPKTIINID